MIAVKNAEEFTEMVNEYVRIPQIGDTLEVNFGFNPDLSLSRYEDRWAKYWNNPIRDEEERTMAEQIIRTGGVSIIYSRAHFKREFRAVPQVGNYKEINLDELSI